MIWLRGARALAVIGVAGAMAGSPMLVALARPKPPVIEAPPPPPPPAGPVMLPQRTLAEAAAFQAYMERVDATSPAFRDGPSIALALRNDAAYEPNALIRGAVAYAAIAALQDQGFVAELRAAGNSPDNRRLMVGYLLADPGYALLFRGSDRAAGLAREALGSAGLKLYGAGKTVRQASYDIQHQDWSKAEVADRTGRLAAVEAEGQSPLPEADDHVGALQQAASGAQPLAITAGPAAPPYTPLVARAIQLAAIAALGEATDDSYDRLAAVAVDDTTHTCLHMAKLNLYQCLAVAKPNYEDVFCMGQHGMEDTGACLARNAGVALPPEPAPPPAAPPPAKSPSHHTRTG
jgi:hypothetical protein